MWDEIAYASRVQGWPIALPARALLGEVDSLSPSTEPRAQHVLYQSISWAVFRVT